MNIAYLCPPAIFIVMLLYISLTSSFSAPLRKQQDIYFFFIACSCLALFAALRVGTPDTENYLDYYLATPELFEFFNFDLLFQVEPGYYFIMSVFKTFGFDFQQYLFILTLLVLGFVFFTFRKYDKSNFCFVVFVALSYFLLFFIQVRQGISVAVTLFAVLLYVERRYFSAVIFCLVSVSIHVSAIVVLPCLFLTGIIHSSISKHFLIVLFLGLLFCIFSTTLNLFSELVVEMVRFSGLPFLSEKVSLYFDGGTEVQRGFFSVTNIIMIACLFLSWRFSAKFVELFGSYRLYTFSLSMGLISVLIYNSLPYAPDVSARLYKQLSVLLPFNFLCACSGFMGGAYFKHLAGFFVLCVIFLFYYSDAFFMARYF